MTLKLDRWPNLGPLPSTFGDFVPFWGLQYSRQQIWWQKQAKAVEDHEVIQDAIIANLQTTDTTLTIAQEELSDTQDDLAQTQDDLLEVVGALTGTQSDVAGQQTTIVSLDSRITTIESAGTFGTAGIDLAVGGVYKINGTQVVGPRGVAIANAVNAVGVPTMAEFNALVAVVNAHLGSDRTHGLIAP